MSARFSPSAKALCIAGVTAREVEAPCFFLGLVWSVEAIICASSYARRYHLLLNIKCRLLSKNCEFNLLQHSDRCLRQLPRPKTVLGTKV